MRGENAVRESAWRTERYRFYAARYTCWVRRTTKYRKLTPRRHAYVRLRRQNSQNRLAAWLCLFAALCLYAPLTLAAWPARQSCCDAGLCAMPEHHHHHAAASESSAHCDHSAGMTDCNMACCEQHEHAAIAPVAYVLPAPATTAAPVVTARKPQAETPNNFFVSLDPLYPPPRA